MQAADFVADVVDNLLGIHALLADGLLLDPTMAGQLRRMPIGELSYRPTTYSMITGNFTWMGGCSIFTMTGRNCVI